MNELYELLTELVKLGMPAEDIADKLDLESIKDIKEQLKNLMEENKKLKSLPPIKEKPEPKEEKIPEKVEKVVEEKVEVQEVKPIKIHQSKGIYSRWNKYRR